MTNDQLQALMTAILIQPSVKDKSLTSEDVAWHAELAAIIMYEHTELEEPEDEVLVNAA